MPVFLDSPYTLTVPAVNTWALNDLSSQVPANAVGVVLYTKWGNYTGNIRARATGAAFYTNLFYNMQTYCIHYSRISDTKQIDLYRTQNEIETKLLGYFTSDEAYFFPSPPSIQGEGTVNWETKDLASYAVGSDPMLGVIFMTPGSGAKEGLSYPGDPNKEYWEYNNSPHFFISACDSNKRVEIYDISYNSYTFIGYFKDRFQHASTEYASFAVVNTWTDMTALPAGANGVVFDLDPNPGQVGMSMGLRPKGWTEELFGELYAAQSYYSGYITVGDENRIIQYKSGSISNRYRIRGYFLAPPAPTSISKKISNTNDDGQWSSMMGTPQGFDVVEPAWNSMSGGMGTATAFLRFTDVTVPKDATVLSAVIKGYADLSNSGTLTSQIAAADSDNPSAPTTASGAANTPTIAEKVNWETPDFVNATRYTTPELKTIVQALVNRSGWVQGNSILFFISALMDGSRDFIDYGDSSTNACVLEIDYITGTVPTPVITIQSITTGDASPTTAPYKVSKVTGKEVCTVVFRCDVDIQAWRIELGGVGQGTGTLLTSGGSVGANVDISANISGTSISGADGNYRINIYAQNMNGDWTPYA